MLFRQAGSQSVRDRAFRGKPQAFQEQLSEGASLASEQV